MANTAGGIAVGMIKKWSGTVANIPAGFQLCDGSNGSPDLRDKFIYGAGLSYNPGGTGGAATHQHTPSGGGGGGAGGGGTSASGVACVNFVSLNFPTITTPAASHLSPYYSLAYIYTKVVGAIPNGGIVMWSGSIASIPAEWQLCNGTNGTPNLIDRFIVCAKQDDSGIAKTNVTGALTQTGGAATHSHFVVTSNSGYYSLPAGSGYGGGDPTGYAPYVIWSVDLSLVAALNLPPYYSLAFIQNVSGGSRGSYTGFITEWSGTIAGIPSGWRLCNGTSSPDLRDRFIVCAKQDDTGIAKTNVSGTLTQLNGFTSQTSPNNTMHSVNYKGIAGLDGPGKSPIAQAGGKLSATFSVAGGGAPVGATNMPPFYSLAYILKN